MSQRKHPELQALKSFIEVHNIYCEPLREKAPHRVFECITFTMANHTQALLVNDEYEDLRLKNPMLTTVLCLRELELLDDAKNLEHWCLQQGIKTPTPTLKEYFKDIALYLEKVKPFFPKGELTSFISDWDFGLNAGAIQTLRKKEK